MRALALALALLLVLGFAFDARAQLVPPPPSVPQLPDEPLPEWHPPPPRRDRKALYLSLTPQMMEAQQLRQIGIWLSSAGWIELFGAGILYVWAANVNNDIGNPAPDNPYGVFQPSLEDKRNNIERSALAFFSIGSVLAAGGFVLYTIGQWRMSAHHKSHPNDPLPPLSGF